MTQIRLLRCLLPVLLGCCATLPRLAAQEIDLRYGANRVDRLAAGAVQDYRFQGAAGDRVTIRIADGTAAFDSRLEVYDPGGALLIGEWDRGGVEFRLNLNLNQNGPYRIRVSEEGDDAGGRYGLSLQRLNASPSAIVLTKGQQQRAAMERLGALRAYLFCGTAGDRVRLRLQGRDAAFDSQLELYSPRGTLLASDFGADGTVASLDLSLEEDGLYTVLAADSGGNDTGEYTLRFDSDGPCTAVGIRPQLCEGQSFVWNGALYDKNRPSDIRVVGDTVYVVWLDFSLPTGFLRDTLCQNDFLVVNGSRYDASNPFGRELLKNRSLNSCDSIVEIDLVFQDTVIYRLQETLCPSASLSVNGNIYDRSRPRGTELISGGTSGGCDSLVEIQLDFYPPATGRLERTLCPGASLIVNGTVYDQGRPSGTELLPGAAANGCDSLVQVQLTFDGPVVGRVEETLCSGASLTVNGTRYDASNPTGTEIIPGAAVGGCDSIVQVRLRFRPPARGALEETLCPGETATVNGTVYDRENPAGVEVLPGAAAGGCDSVVQVRLTYRTGAVGAVEELLCPNDFIRVNGTIYDRMNPVGTEVIPGAAPDGCDSVIQVRLRFYPEAMGIVEELLCPDEFIRVNGTIYDRLHPSGTEVFPGAATNGCDSLVQVRLRFYPEARGRLEQMLCPDELITLNGTIYDRFNPEGTEVLPGAAANGCDSVVQVRLGFYSGGIEEVAATLCPGASLEVNGNIYDQLNPTGTEILPGAAASGCDSLIEVQLDFLPEATGRFEQRLCPGTSIVVNGTEYDEANPTGTEVLPGAAVSGCDSLVQVVLTFDTLCGVPADFYIPSGITPNGDGLNDRFVIPALASQPDAFDDSELIIANRWGQVVFQAAPYRNEWDGGNREGVPLPAGTYFYRFRYGEGERRGEVTILR